MNFIFLVIVLQNNTLSGKLLCKLKSEMKKLAYLPIIFYAIMKDKKNRGNNVKYVNTLDHNILQINNFFIL